MTGFTLYDSIMWYTPPVSQTVCVPESCVYLRDFVPQHAPDLLLGLLSHPVIVEPVQSSNNMVSTTQQLLYVSIRVTMFDETTVIAHQRSETPVLHMLLKYCVLHFGSTYFIVQLLSTLK